MLSLFFILQDFTEKSIKSLVLSFKSQSVLCLFILYQTDFDIEIRAVLLEWTDQTYHWWSRLINKDVNVYNTYIV